MGVAFLKPGSGSAEPHQDVAATAIGTQRQVTPLQREKRALQGIGADRRLTGFRFVDHRQLHQLIEQDLGLRA